jgi:hypothetical protein
MPEQMTADAKPCETGSVNLDDYGPGEFFSNSLYSPNNSRHYV